MVSRAEPTQPSAEPGCLSEIVPSEVLLSLLFFPAPSSRNWDLLFRTRVRDRERCLSLPFGSEGMLRRWLGSLTGHHPPRPQMLKCRHWPGGPGATG